MKEYEIKVTEEKVVYVEAESENEAKELAKTEAVSVEPETIECEVLSTTEE